jgi:hypothetical protein
MKTRETLPTIQCAGRNHEHGPERLAATPWALVAIAALSLMTSLLPSRVEAAPCSGDTITPTSPANTAVTCEGGTTTVEITGRLGAYLNGSDDSVVLSGVSDGSLMVNTIGGSTIDTAGAVVGGVDFSGVSGSVVFNHGGDGASWSFAGDNVRFGSGDDLLNNAGLVMASAGTSVGGAAGVRRVRRSTLNFGAGQDVFDNQGVLVAGTNTFDLIPFPTGANDQFLGPVRPSPRGLNTGSETMVTSLEVFNNSGLIVMGGYVNSGYAGSTPPRFYTSSALGEAYCRSVLPGTGAPSDPPGGYLCTDSPLMTGDTNRLANDALLMPGVAFTGIGNSTILMDAMFGNGVAQRTCDERDANNYFLLGADCIDISGGTTAGSTQVIVRDARPVDQAAYNLEGIVLIDVSGGTSAAEHFTLSPESDFYRTTVGGRGVIDKGLFVFPLIYDESTQQHKLVGIPGASAFQLPLMTHAAQALGRQTMGVGLEGRVQGWQSALRSGTALRGGFWGELQQDEAERDVVQPIMAVGETFAFNNDFDQDTNTMVLGGDFLIPTTSKAAWVIGGSIGYARSQLAFDASGNNAELEGVVFGLHGGYQTESWYLNAAYGQSFLQVDHYVDTYNLSTAGSGADTKAGTEGLRFDGGFRLAMSDTFTIEPIATLAWVRADIDDLVIASPDNPLATSNTARFDNAVSLRGALGARIGFEMPISSLRIHYGLTGRYWNEFDGETKVVIASTGPDANLADTFDGSFLDLAGRIGISDSSGNVSGYIDARSTSGDDYSSLGLSAGFRYQW